MFAGVEMNLSLIDMAGVLRLAGSIANPGRLAFQVGLSRCDSRSIRAGRFSEKAQRMIAHDPPQSALQRRSQSIASLKSETSAPLQRAQ